MLTEENIRIVLFTIVFIVRIFLNLRIRSKLVPVFAAFGHFFVWLGGNDVL